MGKVNKIKVVKKNNQSFVEFDSIKGQTLDLTAVDAISTNSVAGLIPMQLKEHGRSFKLFYNVTGLNSLNQYLRENQLNKMKFGNLLRNIFNIQQELQAAHFKYQSLLMDFGKIKVDPASNNLYFIYIPIQYYDNQVTLKQFLLQIIEHATFDSAEDNDYVREYIQILNTGVNFSLFELGEYIKSLTGVNEPVIKMKKCLCCGREVPSDANNCPHCHNSFSKSGKTGSITGGMFYDPSVNNASKIDDDNKSSDESNIEPPTGVLGEAADDFDDEPPTDVLNSEPIIKYIGYIKRLANNEKIEITKDKFVVGRSVKADYTISDNSTIGRSHSIIVSRDNSFFIIDNDSLNKTYVDNEVIAPQTEIQIFDQTQIKLSNEEFVFEIEVRKE